MRYFCGRYNTSDASNTAKSSDARKTSASVTWLSSYRVYVPSPVSLPLSHLCCLLRVHHRKGLVSILLHWTGSCFLIVYFYLSASSKRSCFFNLYCMNTEQGPVCKISTLHWKRSCFSILEFFETLFIFFHA